MGGTGGVEGKSRQDSWDYVIVVFVFCTEGKRCVRAANMETMYRMI